MTNIPAIHKPSFVATQLQTILARQGVHVEKLRTTADAARVIIDGIGDKEKPTDMPHSLQSINAIFHHRWGKIGKADREDVIGFFMDLLDSPTANNSTYGFAMFSLLGMIAMGRPLPDQISAATKLMFDDRIERSKKTILDSGSDECAFDLLKHLIAEERWEEARSWLETMKDKGLSTDDDDLFSGFNFRILLHEGEFERAIGLANRYLAFDFSSQQENSLTTILTMFFSIAKEMMVRKLWDTRFSRNKSAMFERAKNTNIFEEPYDDSLNISPSQLVECAIEALVQSDKPEAIFLIEPYPNLCNELVVGKSLDRIGFGMTLLTMALTELDLRWPLIGKKSWLES